MNPSFLFRKSLISLAIAGTLGLSACGGDSTSNTGNLTSGVITGFGSVFVNGVEYDTTGATITRNGAPVNETDLAIGQVVTLRGSTNGNGGGTAVSIAYNDEIRGMVDVNDFVNSSSLTVMGLTVRIDPATTVFNSQVTGVTGFDTIQAGNIVEISGSRLDDTTIQASYIDVKLAAHNGEEIEVKGKVSALATTSFQIGSMVVDITTASTPANLSDGMFVEVKSTQGKNANGELVASRVEPSRSGIEGESGEEIEISGPIGINPSAAGFMLNGTAVVIDQNTSFEHGTSSMISEGMQVEVEGILNDSGQLLAQQIAFEEAVETELMGTVSAVDTNNHSLTVMGLAIGTSTRTIFKDDSPAAIRFFDLADIIANDQVKISFYQDDASGALMARKVKRIAMGNQSEEIDGVIETINGNLLTVAGITIDINAITSPAGMTVGSKIKVQGSFDSNLGQFVATSLALKN